VVPSNEFCVRMLPRCMPVTSTDSVAPSVLSQRDSNILMVAVNKSKAGMDVIQWLVQEQHIDPNDADDVSPLPP
jgi:hypothetical protein